MRVLPTAAAVLALAGAPAGITVPFTWTPGQIEVAVAVNGTPATFLLDTGSEYSVVSTMLATPQVKKMMKNQLEAASTLRPRRAAELRNTGIAPNVYQSAAVRPAGPDPITTTFRTANFQYFFIACLVAGSILGMPHRVLVQGFIRMFVPLLVGTLCAVAGGIAVGLLFGHSPKETFFFVIIPIIGGGLAEGVLPLSIAYSEMLHRPQAELVDSMVEYHLRTREEWRRERWSLVLCVFLGGRPIGGH